MSKGKMGRPQVENPRTKSIIVRVTSDEHKALKDVAEADGVKSVSVWVRKQGAKRAKRLGINWPES